MSILCTQFDFDVVKSERKKKLFTPYTLNSTNAHLRFFYKINCKQIKKIVAGAILMTLLTVNFSRIVTPIIKYFHHS